VRLLEYKENGSEFTEMNVYSREVTEKDGEIADYFAFGFTVKGRGDEEKEKIEKMNEREFEEFIRHMTLFIERKYNIVHKKEEKKENKEEEKEKEEEDENQTIENAEDFELPTQNS
jgi:chromatin remodeling complex protein RSC6